MLIDMIGVRETWLLKLLLWLQYKTPAFGRSGRSSNLFLEKESEQVE